MKVKLKEGVELSYDEYPFNILSRELAGNLVLDNGSQQMDFSIFKSEILTYFDVMEEWHDSQRAD